VSNKESTPSAVPAPSEVPDAAIREQAKALAAGAAFDIKGDCPHCDGTGRGDEVSKKIVHSFSPAGFGADWSLDHLLAVIDGAEYVRWVDSVSGHDLVVENNGKPYRFQVKRPAQVEGAA